MYRVPTKSYTTLDYYASYLEHSKGASADYKVNRRVFRNIISDYFKFLASEIIDEGKEVTLPSRLGTIQVIKKKPLKFERKNLAVDFKTTNELGKVILHLNEHTSGYRYRFRWRKQGLLTRNGSMYQLIMSRGNKRGMAHNIKVLRKDYIEK